MTLPVSLDDAKRHLRIIGDDDNAEITGFISDAAEWVEDYTGHLLEQREVTEQFESFLDLRLRHWPITSDTVTVSAAGSPVTGARLLYPIRPGRILPAVDTYWPSLSTGDLIEVTYTAGYASPADVPRKFVRAMLVLISGFYEDREGGQIFCKAEETAKRLCRSKKAWAA